MTGRRKTPKISDNDSVDELHEDVIPLEYNNG